jgi:hypothetical protein
MCSRDQTQHRKRTATIFVAAAIITLISPIANAADFPNVIGTWMISNKGRSVTTPYQQAQDASSVVKIVRQDGEPFSGTVVDLKGKTERIVGAFRRDGRTFIYSSAKTAGMGKVQGNEMEICRTDAGCALLIRSK